MLTGSLHHGSPGTRVNTALFLPAFHLGCEWELDQPLRHRACLLLQHKLMDPDIYNITFKCSLFFSIALINHHHHA